MRNWLLRRQLRKMNRELRKVMKVNNSSKTNEDDKYGGDD